MLNLYEQIDRNKRRSIFVIIFFTAFIAVVSYFIGRILGYGQNMIILALMISFFSGIFGYYFSDKIILTISGAHPATRQDNFNFYTAVENISLGAKIPMPKLYVIDDSAPNAFATGRDPNHAVVAATSGLLNKLNKTEIEGVVAHEISHIKNYDMRLMTVVAIFVGMITLLSDFLLRGSFRSRSSDDENSGLGVIFLISGFLLALLSPLIGQLIQLALSRRREFLADAGSVMITRQPSGLISALKKISSDPEVLEAANKATASLYIVNPLKGKDGNAPWLNNLFNTHPPLEERIKSLEGLE